jgi:hypothetical protein
VEAGFGKKEVTVRSDEAADFFQMRMNVRHFMEHPECIDEIVAAVNANTACLAEMGMDEICHPFCGCAGKHSLEHFWLKIGRDDKAVVPDDARHGDGGEPPTAADIQNPHAGADPWRIDTVWLVQHASERVFQVNGVFVGADMGHGILLY